MYVYIYITMYIIHPYIFYLIIIQFSSMSIFTPINHSLCPLLTTWEPPQIRASPGRLARLH